MNSMNKLKRIQSPESDRLSGYLEAAQYICIKGQYDVMLDAACFEILDKEIDDEDVVDAAYQGGYNPIEHRAECSVEAMVAGVHNTLSLSRGFWKPEYTIPDLVENNIREGYWRHVGACIDYKNARVVELGWHVPHINISGGFTYVLYAGDKKRCMLLVGNVSD
jgi:hypothetical protein